MININAQFDGGNIECLACEHATDIRLRIRPDQQSEFYQWFHFRLTGATGQACTLNISNADGAAYAGGWENYSAVASYDLQNWFRVPTEYHAPRLQIKFTPQFDSVYFAYFAPYSQDRHRQLIAGALADTRTQLIVPGQTLDGRDIDVLKVCDDDCLGANAKGTHEKKVCWAIARQHPGETMAEWWMEGFIHRLLDRDDASAQQLLSLFDVYIVPNMNPDGSFRGHLRTNAAGANLNREWDSPSAARSPEVFYVRAMMEQSGVDLCLDVHGDETLPYNFIAGTEGIVAWNDTRDAVLNEFKQNLASLNPDFQTVHGYPRNAPGKANLKFCSNNIAHHFQCLAMTLEMPFKDANDTPKPVTGWSPVRAQALGESCLQAMLDIAPALEQF